MKLKVRLAKDAIWVVAAQVGSHGTVGDHEPALQVLDEKVIGDLVEHSPKPGSLFAPLPSFVEPFLALPQGIGQQLLQTTIDL
jgi:hypothetical protein